MGSPRPKTLKERAFEVALESAIRLYFGASDVIRLTRRVRTRLKALRKR
jgi:hypothetical protein